MDFDAARAMFERELGTVEDVIDWTCRDRGLRGDEADSFRSYVHERLMDDSYAVLRSFTGRSRLRTFLGTVVSNAYVDYRVARWGRWRPSAAAQREGRIGRLLDARLNRDSLPLDHAIEELLSRADVDVGESELRRIAASLPRRARREFTSLAHTPPLPGSVDADQETIEAERQRLWVGAREALERALGCLDPDDRAVVQLHVLEGMSIADVARVMNVRGKPLYRRFHRACARLREGLEREGLDENLVRELLPS